MKIVQCHPERKHCARGKCSPCYWRERYAEPEFRERRKAYNREYYRDAASEPAVAQVRRDTQRERRANAR